MVTTYLHIHFFLGVGSTLTGVQLSWTNLMIISFRCFIYDKMQDAGRTVQKAINNDLFRVEETSQACCFESCFLFQCSSNSTFPFFLLRDSLNKKIFKTYLSTENTCVLRVLCNFHFFHHFTEWGTITCTILPDNSNLLGPLCLEKEHTRHKPTESELPCNSYIVKFQNYTVLLQNRW